MAKDRARKDSQNLRRKTVLTASYVTEVAVMAGMLTALKFALSFVPNVEVVTLLIAVFSAYQPKLQFEVAFWDQKIRQ